MTGTIAVMMVFPIPIVAIVTNHFQKQTEIKKDILKDELELDKLKHENYIIETGKMGLELQQMKIGQDNEEITLQIR